MLLMPALNGKLYYRLGLDFEALLEKKTRLGTSIENKPGSS